MKQRLLLAVLCFWTLSANAQFSFEYPQSSNYYLYSSEDRVYYNHNNKWEPVIYEETPLEDETMIKTNAPFTLVHSDRFFFCPEVIEPKKISDLVSGGGNRNRRNSKIVGMTASRGVALKVACNREDLAGRNQDETGIRYEWYALQRWGAKYYKEFDEEKLIYIHTAKNHEFYYDTEKHYVNNSCYIIASMSKFLYCFLNSSLFNYFKRIKFVAYGDGAEEGRCKLDGNKMATVPIKANVDESPFEKKFELLQQAVKVNDSNRLFSLEREIDNLVYHLYGLTEEEIKIVEGCE